MAFKLYKGNSNATVATETFVASGAIAIDMPVYLVAGASGAVKAKVAQMVGGAGSGEKLLGVAMHAAADTADVLIALINDEQQWIVDSVADANVSNAGADNYLTATTLTITVGASSANGRKCRIIGKLGTAAQRKYIVQLGNFGVSDATGTPVIFTYTVASDVTTATPILTAPFAFKIDDFLFHTTVGEASNTIGLRKATTLVATALATTAAGAITRMAAGVVTAECTIAAGDILNIIAAGGSNGANQRGILVIFGHRI